MRADRSSGKTLAILAVFVLSLAASRAKADGSYSPWQYDKEKERYSCKYTYDAKDGGTNYNIVLYYPKSSPRTDYYYYANSKGDIWARCACPGNDKYDPKVMYWQAYDSAKEKFNNYDKAGFCPTPKDGKDAIAANIPDPPVQK